MNRAIAALACALGLFAFSPIMASEVEGYVDTVSVGSDGLIRFTLKNIVVLNSSCQVAPRVWGLFPRSRSIHPKRRSNRCGISFWVQRMARPNYASGVRIPARSMSGRSTTSKELAQSRLPPRHKSTAHHSGLKDEQAQPLDSARRMHTPKIDS